MEMGEGLSVSSGREAEQRNGAPTPSRQSIAPQRRPCMSSNEPTTKYFNPVDPLLFDASQPWVEIDSKKDPYIYNDSGKPVPVPQVQGTLIPQADEWPEARLGQVYHGITWQVKTIPTDTSSY